MRSASWLGCLLLMSISISCGGGDTETGASRAGSVASADGVMIHYEVSGTGNPPLVFVHGWSCDLGFWEAQRDDFAVRQRVVLVDLAGHGASGRERERWTMASFGADVKAVVEALDLEGVVLIGHSMGGAVIAEAARAMPARVRGLVGVDNFQQLSLDLSAEQIEGFVAAFEADFEGTARPWVGSMFPADADSALVERVVESMVAAPPEIARDALRELLHWYNSQAESLLTELEVPLQCINSDRQPTDVLGLAAIIPGYELHLMPGRGHFLMLEDPPTFNRLLELSLADFAGAPVDS